MLWLTIWCVYYALVLGWWLEYGWRVCYINSSYWQWPRFSIQTSWCMASMYVHRIFDRLHYINGSFGIHWALACRISWKLLRKWKWLCSSQCIPYILAYKPTISVSILTVKLWGSAYTRVMPDSQSQHDSNQSATLTVCVPHTAWTISRSLGLCGCVGRARHSEWPHTDLCCCCCCIASHCNLHSRIVKA